MTAGGGVRRVDSIRVVGGPYAELVGLYRSAKVALRSGGRPWAGASAALLSAVAAAGYQWTGSRHVLLLAGGVRADLPWWEELLRLPVSAFLPTSELPLLGAIAQLLIVIGLGELIAGRSSTIAVAAGGQIVSSLAARMMIASGGAVGLAAFQAGVLDTGPSGMTTAVGAWLLARGRCYWCLGALAVVLGCGALVENDLDGREHLIALLFGVAAAAGQGVARLMRSPRPRTPAVANRVPELARAQHFVD